MSANKTRLLFADDTDLLARARSGIMDRPEFDVVMAASTDEALQFAADVPPLGAVVLPADGQIDGLQVCRTLKAAPNARTMVILALSADESGKRDACFAAGADDVVFAPIEAAEIASRLDRGVLAQRNAPRADVELVVRIASPGGNAVVDASGMQISREAIQVTLPGGMPPPKAGMLLRVVFTLYEGGTLQVWARAGAPDPARTVLRFVGLTEPERRAIDYFVDFYLKRAGTTVAPTNGNGVAKGNGSVAAALDAAVAGEPDELLLSHDEDPAPANAATSIEELLLSATIPSAPASTPSASAPAPAETFAGNELVRVILEAPIEQLVEAATSFAAGREAKVPPGIDPGRVRNLLPRLSPAETSALRGTTMYNNILGDLRECAGARIRLMEMAIALRDGGTRLDKRSAEQAALGAITEAQQIHKALDAGFQQLLKGGNTSAVRDLGPVKAGLLGACVELKTALDRHVLEKEPGAAVPNAKVPPRTSTQTKYEPSTKNEPRPDKSTRGESKPKAVDETPSGNRRVIAVVVLVVLFFGGLWSNRDRFGVPVKPPAFRPEKVLFESNGVRVWQSSVDAAGTTITWIVDGTVDDANEEARAKLLEDLVTRSPGMKTVRLIDYRNKEIASRSL